MNGRIVIVETSDQLNEDPPDIDSGYKIRSTALGGAVVYDSAHVHIHAGGTRIAMQNEYGIMWNHSDPNSRTYRSTISDGTVLGSGTWNVDWDKIETDPDGKSVGLTAPVYYPLESNELYTNGWSFGSMINGQYTLNVVDGIHVPRDFFFDRISIGGGISLIDFLTNSAREVGRWYRNHDGPTIGDNDEIIRVHTQSRYLRTEFDYSFVPGSLIRSFIQRQSPQQDSVRDAINTVSTGSPPSLGKNDCLDFARKADSLAKEYLDQRYPNWDVQIQKFMDVLVSWGSEYTSATASALRNTQAMWTQHMESTGFRKEYSDPYFKSSDQVRHAIGGLFAGYVGGRIAHEFMNRVRESSFWDESTKESHDADIALNNVTIPMGRKLAGKDNFGVAKGLGAWIRNELCATAQEGIGRGV